MGNVIPEKSDDNESKREKAKARKEKIETIIKQVQTKSKKNQGEPS